jgi:hypothetical protein
MSKLMALTAILACLALAAPAALAQGDPRAAAQPAAAGAPFTIARLVLCTGLENREPVGAAEAFPASAGKVYCFIEARDVAAESTLTVAWKLDGTEIGRTDLVLKASARWRTNAWKTVSGRPGAWEVLLLDSAGKEIQTAAFQVK